MAALENNTDQETSLFRTALRREKIAARNALPETVRVRAEIAIADKLRQVLERRAHGIIGFCWPIQGEVDCRSVVTHLLDRGWHACQPIVEKAAAPMTFRAWTRQTPMKIGEFGIPVPDAGETVCPSVLLIPVVAFDRHGYRLGYGGGYFDRTLAALTHKPLTLGIGFELAAVTDLRPHPRDIPMDAIVTEAGIHPGSASRDNGSMAWLFESGIEKN